jgi:hypothetical protein
MKQETINAISDFLNEGIDHHERCTCEMCRFMVVDGVRV